MSSAFAWWWWALPVLLLPIWWHREKRQRLSAEPLATARFLPKAPPQQMRVWAWVDRLLLLLRCLLLVGVLAWLADVAVPWRGDTVLLSPGIDPAWAEAQVKEAGLSDAGRLSLSDADALTWLVAHEREWTADARLLLLASGDAVPMAAQAPRLAHQLDLRVQPVAMPATTLERHVVIVSERAAEWRSLFKAFESAGQGRDRYVFDETPTERTELIVWDKSGEPDARWRAPLWWRNQAPPQDLDAARALYAEWRPQQPYAAPSMKLAASNTTPALLPIGALHGWLAPLLVLLFGLERLLAHVRRR